MGSKSLGSQEGLLVTIVGLISFLSGMVFSMVGALAPMLQHDLGIPAQSIGKIMGVYMLASATSGFLGTLYLDRFDRRKGLAVTLSGVVVGLIMTGLAPNLHLLLMARVLSGVFAGPSSALAIAIVIDNIPIERRGRALGSIAAFQGFAQVLGIPIGLYIAQAFDSWRSPFFAIAVAGALLLVWVQVNLPAQRAHLTGPGVDVSIGRRLKLLGELLSRPICLVAFSLQLTGIVPLVAITTIMSVFLVNNLGYPREGLQELYVIGGLSNFIISRLLGRAVDRFGPGIVSTISSALMTWAVAVGYMGLGLSIVTALQSDIAAEIAGGSMAGFWSALRPHGILPELLPVIAVFAVFFFTSSARLVVAQTVTLKIPKPDERAGFQSLSQSIQSFAMALSALSIPVLLGSTPDGKFTGIVPFASGVLVVTWVFPFLVYWLNSLLVRRDRAASLSAAAAAAE